MMAACVKRHLS